MFDFFNYNFSSLISIFAALMGMAYPLILQAIQRIDDMYKSTKLATFFQNQWFFRLFSGLLLVSIPISVVAPFLLYYHNSFRWMVVISTFHAIVVFALAISAFILFKFILKTTNPIHFLMYLDCKLKNVHPPLTEIFQILKYASDKEDDELFQKTLESLYVRISAYRKHRGTDVAAVEVWKVLRELLKQHSKRKNNFFSTQNLITIYFLNFTEKIDLSEEEYIYLWQTVDAVIHTDNDSWVYSYWTYSDQYYRFTLDNSTNNSEENKWQQERFKEQHFMIGALLTYNKMYVLLNKLMYFSNNMPPRYELVPSCFIDVISQLKQLIKMKFYPNQLTKRYLMIGAPQDVSSDEFILRYAYKYASLLLIRLFTVNNWNITYSNPMDFPEIPSDSTIESLNAEVGMMNRLKNEISLWFEEQNAIEQTIDNIEVSVVDVHELCNRYIEQCKQKIEELNNTMEVDPKKKAYIKQHLLSALKDYPLVLPILTDVCTDEYKKRPVNNRVAYQIDKEMLRAGTNINASNLPDVIIGHLNELAYKAYNYLFLLQPSVVNIRIAYRDIKRVLDVIGINKDYVVLSLGVYLGNFEMFYGKESDEKFAERDGRLSYKECNIYSIPSTQQCFIVMRKCDMPFIKKEELSDFQNLELIDKDEYFYSDIDNLNELSENNEQLLHVDRGIYLYSKENFKYIRLNIDYNSGFETDMKKVKEAREVAWA